MSCVAYVACASVRLLHYAALRPIGSFVIKHVKYKIIHALILKNLNFRDDINLNVDL